MWWAFWGVRIQVNLADDIGIFTYNVLIYIYIYTVDIDIGMHGSLMIFGWFHILIWFNLGVCFISGPFTSSDPFPHRMSQGPLESHSESSHVRCYGEIQWRSQLYTWNTKVVVSDHKFAIEHENDGRLGMILETNTCPRCFCCLWLEGIRWPGRKYCNVSRLPSAYFRTNKKLGGRPQLQWRLQGRGR